MSDRVITLSVRVTRIEAAALQAIAERIGNGASVAGVVYQLIQDRIEAELQRIIDSR